MLDMELMERDHEVLPLVYFVSAPDKVRFPIKIGRSTTNAIHGRLGTLQTGMPYKLHFMLVVEADPAFETQVHRALADIRLEGEWFKRTTKLLDFISALEAEEPDWRELLLPRYKFKDPEYEQRVMRADEELERMRLDVLRQAMNATDAYHGITQA